MDVELITSLVSSVGFPIVCCVALGYYVNTTLKDFTKTMNENTRMLSILCDKWDVSYKEGVDDE